MQKGMKKSVYFWIFCAIMLLSLIGMLYYGSRKSGYHVDEVYSYGLANSEYLPFMHFGESGYDVKDWMIEYGAGESLGDLCRNLINDFRILKENNFEIYSSPICQDYLVAQANSADTRTSSWVSGQDYLHYIAVSPDNTFNYASVYYNQRGDVHPPFFYILLHTICSVFQGSFSKWFGIGLNIVFMLLTLLTVYKMCCKFLGDELFGVCVAAVYGLSCGFVTTAIYIRMYAVLSFMVAACCYLHLSVAQKGFAMDKKTVGKLAVITFLGYFTHYYYVLYAIAMAVVFCVWMLLKKKIKNMLIYITAMAGTAGVGICIWPFAIRHVFQGYRGMGAVKQSLSGGAYGLKTRLMLDLIWSQVAGGYRWLPIALAILLVIVALIWKRKELPWGKAAVVSVPVLFYVVATAQIVPFYADRYVMCSYYFWCILMTAGIFCGVRIPGRKLFRGKSRYGERILNGTIIFLVAGLVLVNNCIAVTPGYLYEGGQETVIVPENTDCLYVLPDGSWNTSATYSTILAQCKTVGIVYDTQIDVMSEEYQFESGEHLMLYVQNELDVDVVVENVHSALGTGKLKEIFREKDANTTRIVFAE